MNCGKEKILERYFGRQQTDYGFLRLYEKTSTENFKPKYYESFPENVYIPNLGFTGFQKVSPDSNEWKTGNYSFLELYYFGITPLKIQPRYNPPQPYLDFRSYGFGF